MKHLTSVNRLKKELQWSNRLNKLNTEHIWFCPTLKKAFYGSSVHARLRWKTFLELACLSNRLNKHVWFLPYTEKEMLISPAWKVLVSRNMLEHLYNFLTTIVQGCYQDVLLWQSPDNHSTILQSGTLTSYSPGCNNLAISVWEARHLSEGIVFSWAIHYY